MLRSPLAVLSDYRWSAAAVVVSLAAILWFGAAVAMAALQVKEVGASWWENYSPLVYLEAGVDSAVLRALTEELEGWSEVSQIVVEEPSVALRRLEERLGDDEVQRLGLDVAMMPTTLVISPALWRPGQAELVARLKALEVRDEVVGVDVPEAKALHWLSRAKMVGLGVGLAIFLGLLGALGGLAMFLRRVQENERRENHLLEVFGASPRALRQAALWRGVVLGVAAGVLSGVGLLPWALALDEVAATVSGASADGAVRAALMTCALVVLGVVLGGLVGWSVGQPRGARAEGRLESLLRWEWE